MHEYPITEEIIRITEKYCIDAGAHQIKKVNLVIGEYSGYVGDSVQMYFDIISQDTLCEGAIVEIDHIKPKLECSECGELFEKEPMTFDCPKCGGQGKLTEIGKEFYIKSIEVE